MTPLLWDSRAWLLCCGTRSDMTPLLVDSRTWLLCCGTVGHDSFLGGVAHDSLGKVVHDSSVMHWCPDGVTFRAAVVMCLESSGKETASPCRRFLVDVWFCRRCWQRLKVKLLWSKVPSVQSSRVGVHLAYPTEWFGTSRLLQRCWWEDKCCC